jgi:hypothetical protein
MKLGGIELTYEGACVLIEKVIVPAVIGRLDDTVLWGKKPQAIEIFSCDLAGIDDNILVSIHIAHPTNDKLDIRFIRAYPYHFEFNTTEGVTEWALEIGQTLYDGIQEAAKSTQKVARPKKKKP